VRLDLPAQYARLAQTFHVEKLKRFTPSGLDWPGRQQLDRPRPTLVVESMEYEVERVVGKKITWEEVDESQGSESEREEEKSEEKREETPAEAEVEAETKVDREREAPQEEQKEALPGRVTRSRAAAARKAGRELMALQAGRATKATTEKEKVKRAVVWYLVQWKGYPEENNSWVRAEDMHADDAIREYEEAQQRGDDLGFHYLHALGSASAEGVQLLSTRLVGDWTL
jgi:Chromo (CHRromatin Organisation MOdifier) domain